jgi:hypothetical protein
MNDDQLRTVLAGHAESFNLGTDIPPRVLRRARRRQLVGVLFLVLTTVSAVTLAVFVSTSYLADRGGTSSAGPEAAGSSSEPSSAPPNTFSPPITQEGDRLRMPVVFPDGSTTELVYKDDLELTEIGISSGSVVLDLPPASADDMSCLSELHISFGDPRGSFYTGDSPRATYEGAMGSAEVWDGTSGSPYSLVFRFGSWVVSSHCDSIPEEDDPLVASLNGEETREGYLVLSLEPPVSLIKPAEEDVGATLFFGLQGKFFELAPGPCTISGHSEQRETERYPGGASWCLDEGLLRVTVHGTEEFIATVHDNLTADGTVLAEDR